MSRETSFSLGQTGSPPRSRLRHFHCRTRDILWFGSLLAFLGFACVVGAAVGTVNFPLSQTVHIIVDTIRNKVFGSGANDYPAWQQTILIWVRVPRVLVGAMVGGGLALTGAVMQGVFRNPMADPGLIGVSAGAALGAVLMLYSGTATFLHLYVPAAAIAGALVCSFLVYALASSRGRSSVSTLVLSGIAISSIAGALTSFVLSLSLRKFEVGRQILTWLLGDLEARSWGHVAIAAPIVLGGCAWLCCYARELNVLAIGEENAMAVGIDVRALRRKLLILASLVTGTTVAVVGGISFVGLILPHIMRLLLGPDNRRVMPASLLGGAAFLVLADTLCRTEAVQDLRLGVITALCGSPFFLYLLIKSRYSG